MQEFRESMNSLDADAFKDKESFWSIIEEQMEIGLL